MKAIKHLVQCRCILPQFKRIKNPPFHQFVVFSIFDEDDKIKVKFSQCPNCGIIHKVLDVSKSEILSKKEHMSSILTVNDIKSSIGDENVVAILESNDLDIASWEYAKYIIDNELWGEHIVLSRDVEGDDITIKYIRFISKGIVKVESEVHSEVLKNYE